MVYEIANCSDTQRNTINHASNVICQQCVVVFSGSICLCKVLLLDIHSMMYKYIYFWHVCVDRMQLRADRQSTSQLGSSYLKAADEPQNETNTTPPITIIITAQTIDEQYNISHFTCASHLFFRQPPMSNVFYSINSHVSDRFIFYVTFCTQSNWKFRQD